MPAYLQHFAIDWGWPELSEAERRVVRGHEASLQADPGTHTRTTFEAQLASASRQLPGRELRASLEDEDGEHALVARDGGCVPASEALLREEGKFPEVPSVDDYRAAGVEKLHVGLYWPDAMLQAVAAQAARLDRSLSWVVQRAWLVAKEKAWTQPAESELPRDGAKRRQSIYLPLALYAELDAMAARQDSSMSTLVHRALAVAWPAIRGLPR